MSAARCSFGIRRLAILITGDNYHYAARMAALPMKNQWLIDASPIYGYEPSIAIFITEFRKARHQLRHFPSFKIRSSGARDMCDAFIGASAMSC